MRKITNETETRKKRRVSRRRRPALWRRAAYGALRLCMWAVAALLLVAFVGKVWHPYGLKRRVGQDIVETRKELTRVREDNERQRRRMQYLQTPQGAAAEARKLGYHFKGEVPLRLQEPAVPKPAAPAPAAPAPAAPPR